MKKALSTLLFLAILISIAGCGEDPIATESSNQTIPTTAESCQHDFQIVDQGDGTCTEPGWITYACTLCGEKTTDQTSTAGHSYVDATCIAAKTCTACGVTDGESLGHNYSSGICNRCGTQMPDYEEKPVGCDHEYVLTEQIAPACTTEGSFTYSCSQCGNSYAETIAAKGHLFTSATCNEAKTCRICNATDGDALGHSYKYGKCERCGAPDPAVPAEVTYTVTVRSDKGKLVEGVTVSIFTDGDTPAAVGRTNSSGVATMKLMSSASYKVILSDVPEGFAAKDSYTFRSTRANINLTTLSQILPDDHSKANYKVGSIMGDFTLTDTDGNSYTLSMLLKDKDLVILNFWFVNCGPCKAEFPYFETVHNKYDNVQLLTLNHIDADAHIKALRQQMGVTFPMIAEDIGFQQGFDIGAYPTTVFIDSTGKILKIKVGEFKTLQELEQLIDGFL